MKVELNIPDGLDEEVKAAAQALGMSFAAFVAVVVVLAVSPVDDRTRMIQQALKENQG